MLNMNKILFPFIYAPILFFFLGCKEVILDGHIKNEIRPPAYPLVMIDPNMNAWSMTDTLYKDHVKHSSGRQLPLVGALRVDGEVYRFMGTPEVAMKPLTPMSKEGEWQGKYTFICPDTNWLEPDFDDTGWKTGKAIFGTIKEKNVETIWPTPDIWIRREVTLTGDALAHNSLVLKYSHDDFFELYINGIQLVKTGYNRRTGVEITIPDKIRETFSDGKIIIAAHCKNIRGAGLVDFGIYIKEDQLYLGRNAVQKSVDVQATQTIYTFECGDVELKLNFVSPFLADDLELISGPFNYISYEARSLDGAPHDIQIYFEASPYWASNESKGMNSPQYSEKNNLIFIKTGNTEQKLLDRNGAGWGYFCIAGEKQNSTVSSGYAIDLQEAFALNGRLLDNTSISQNSNIAISQNSGIASMTFGHILIGYDDIYAISYFGDNLRPYWNRDGNKTIEQVFVDAYRKYNHVISRCRRLDYEIMTQARKIGGKEYAELCALAYRQTIASNKLVQSNDNELLYFDKALGAADFFAASAPLFLYFNPELVKALMNPLFEYSESGKWPKAYPARNIGVYPIVSEQAQADLPIEEAGNMLILTAAVTALEGDGSYARKHWEILSKWNDYLIMNGIDTGEQPSTDNFTAVVPHNTNLSIKVIMGVASYAYIARMLNENEISEEYFNKARDMVTEWERLSNAGDHYRIAFDQADSTWGQKYNLIWDKILNLSVFPDSIYKKEIEFYKTKQNIYGLPLDNRAQFTKSNWVSWIAVMAEEKDVFQEFIKPLHRFMSETTDRLPMADFINTNTPTIARRGYTARSVVGAYYMGLLKEKLDTGNNENK